MDKVIGTVNTTDRIKFIKAVYGKEKFDASETIQLGNETLVSWYLIGFETLQDLETKHTDEEIIELYEKQK